jgi:hypothetical protein
VAWSGRVQGAATLVKAAVAGGGGPLVADGVLVGEALGVFLDGVGVGGLWLIGLWLGGL